jgi:hypothetical protein
MRRCEVLNCRSRKDKKSESSTESATHTQILKTTKQKQLNGRSHHIPITTDIECQWTQLPHEKTPFGKLD